ncbi:MAG: LytR/AlgR family response regulator transcription factor [Leadbetterella sp.]
MRAVIIDDEVSCIESLEAKIELFVPSVKVIKTFVVPQEALREIQKIDVEVLFLDIEMPNMNGITFAQKANLQDTEIIYTTAYQKYALDAFKVSAFDFLLKPVDRHELVKCIQRLSEKLEQKKLNSKTKLHTKFNKITVHTTKGMLFVLIQDILWLNSDNNYTTLHTTQGEKIVTSRHIGEFEDLLYEHDFCRIHNSILINLHHISEYIKGDGGSVVLSNGEQLEVSRRRKADLLAMIF